MARRMGRAALLLVSVVPATGGWWWRGGRKARRGEAGEAAVYRPPEPAAGAVVGANPAAVYGRRERDARLPVWLVAGIEGAGHGFFDFVGHRLRFLSEVGERLSPAGAAAYNDLQLCWFDLSTARAHALCNLETGGCDDFGELDGGACVLDRARRAAAASLAPWRGALYVPGCSYPCGDPRSADDLQRAAPDLVRFVREARGAGYAPRVVVPLREPLAACASSHFRRRNADGTFRATCFTLYLNLGLLDAHVRALPRGASLVVHYEDLYSGRNASAVRELADFLGAGVGPASLDAALAYGRARIKAQASVGAAGASRAALEGLREGERRYVESLFFAPSAARHFPRLYPPLRRYRGHRPKHARFADRDRYAFEVEAGIRRATLRDRAEADARSSWFDTFDLDHAGEARARDDRTADPHEKKAELYGNSLATR